MSRFDFKQFHVCQDNCAMKVGTDGVLLGAWADVSGVKEVVDVGCGTGLIALMIAQRCPQAHITAIDIDERAAGQAALNVAASRWSDRIDVVHADYLHGYSSLPSADLVICNPPFFAHSLRPPDSHRATARHDDSLPISRLLSAAAKQLSPGGRVALVVPYDRLDEVITEANFAKLRHHRISVVKTTTTKPPRRVLIELKNDASHTSNPITEEYCIHDADGRYSEWYRNLTHDFYL